MPIVKNGFLLFHGGWPSQWHPSTFKIDGVSYNCAEQWMMAEKARIFKDSRTRSKIMSASHPRDQKRLGRQVAGFNAEAWEKRCRDIVFIGNMAKFSQNDDLRKALIDTVGLRIVEASLSDKIWGIGLAADDPKAVIPRLWRGTNWLGQALERVRTELSKNEELL